MLNLLVSLEKSGTHNNFNQIREKKCFTTLQEISVFFKSFQEFSRNFNEFSGNLP